MRVPALAILLATAAAAISSAETTEEADPQLVAVRGLITRIVAPGRSGSGLTLASRFELKLLAAAECSVLSKTGLCFGYRRGSSDGAVLLEGTTGVELAMAFNHYLKHIANCSVSWRQTGGNQVNLPAVLPLPPAAALRLDRTSKWSYYANVCTFSYSFVWYDLDAWVREIDWMAMNGINLPREPHASPRKHCLPSSVCPSSSANR